MIESMSAAEFNARQSRTRKYRNRKVRIDGRVFDSIAEGARYLDLATLEAGGLIASLQCQPTFALKGERGSVIAHYMADFRYVEDGAVIVEDVKGGKGSETRMFRLKARWLKADYGIDLRIVTRDEIDTSGMDQYVIDDEVTT